MKDTDAGRKGLIYASDGSGYEINLFVELDDDTMEWTVGIRDASATVIFTADKWPAIRDEINRLLIMYARRFTDPTLTRADASDE